MAIGNESFLIVIPRSEEEYVEAECRDEDQRQAIRFVSRSAAHRWVGLQEVPANWQVVRVAG